MKVSKSKFLGAMIFLTILMDVVPYFGFIRFASINITNLHIPAILTAIVLGPGWGVVVGSLFGLISLMRAVSRESAVLDLLLQNPLISILPRLCFPCLAGYLYLFLKKHLGEKNETASVAISAVTGSCLNSVLVLGFLYLIYPDEFLGVLNMEDSSHILSCLFYAFGPNMAVEALACMTVCLIFVYCLRRMTTNQELEE